MKFAAVVLTLAAAGSISASPHHRHRHGHAKREVVTVPGPVVVAYELNGEPMSKEEACAGLADGSLTYADGEKHSDLCKPSAAPSTSSRKDGGEFYPHPTPAPAPTTSTVVEVPKPSTTSKAPEEKPSPPPKPYVPPTDSKPDPPSSSPSGGKGLDRSFPDGEIDCSNFPDEYGALNLKYLGLGGWSGIQHVTMSGNAYGTIHTADKGGECKEGSMCSYACPAGYQKSQWPKTQGALGESVGGLECRGGKLYLTNKTLSNKLCVEGVGGVYVKNTMSELVSVCRTDYPGTESEVVPLLSSPGSKDPLTCPDALKYFLWKDMPTSAQYYVNPAGVEPEDACQWGQKGKNIGNWAPINLGVGQDKFGKKWISIFQNAPTTDAELKFKIEIKGDGLSGTCKYEHGYYHSLTGKSKEGCTVEVTSGDATFVFSS